MTDRGASRSVKTAAPRPRQVLGGLPAYRPGRPPVPIEGLTAYKISSNENPFPPLDSALEAVRRGAEHLNRYPDMGNTALRTRLADYLDVSLEQIACGTGSVAVLRQIIDAMCDAGDEVIYAWRSFEAYPIVTALSGAFSVQVPLTKDYRHDLHAMAAAVTESTKVVLICTPNNPTGTIVTDAEVREFLGRVPSRVLVVIDEAYLEFGTDPAAPDSLAILREHPNVVVLRTFSKAYGLAALRVGYAVAHPEIAEALRMTATPFGVNLLAQEAAVASLDARDELQVRVEHLVAERDRVESELAAQGWDLPPSQANFVWFPLGQDTPGFAQACADQALTVRPYATDGVRATIGEAEASDRLLQIAQNWLAAARHPGVGR